MKYKSCKQEMHLAEVMVVVAFLIGSTFGFQLLAAPADDLPAMIRTDDVQQRGQVLTLMRAQIDNDDPKVDAAVLLSWVAALRREGMNTEAIEMIDRSYPLALTRKADPNRYLRVARLFGEKAAILLEQNRNQEAFASLEQAVVVTDPADAVYGICKPGMVEALVRAGLAAQTLKVVDEAILKLIDYGNMKGMSDVGQLEIIMKFRTNLLLATGKTAEALASAKTLFNVSSIENAPDAVQLIAKCLEAASPEDRQSRQKLLDELSAASKPDNAATSTVLAGIKGDPLLYQHLLASEKIPSAIARDYVRLSRGGYLLLLMDQPHTARIWLEQAYRVCNDEQLPTATESLKRAMKAEDGGIGRINTWVLPSRATPRNGK